ncbi:MAG: zinc carboxypeptidase [Bacteroidia bacterium]|nr:zinc carboxypeptidase [Bacteroidia bacterium]
MNRIIILTGIILGFIQLNAQNKYDLNYYLPEFTVENTNVPTPKEVIGHEVGDMHISHDRLVQYMYKVAESSERVKLERLGWTFETRQQLVLVITSPENHKRLDEIREQHLNLTDPQSSASVDIKDMPVVIYQGFSIHGNEPSGANGALALAYYYAAAGNPKLKEQLDNAVILLDPSLNPDGLNRFASWVNTSRSVFELNGDPQNREQNEMWPGGRTNHFWFDLNRDWLPVQLPESRNRIAYFHKWKPNILTDHHEMGTNSTFFFQPGIPSRNNPNTPARNFELTEEIGTYHAKALDEIGSLYYSKESFDDFYYGKGSTFPDINGGIGILFEQASSRGHKQESVNGMLEFPFTIRNQVRTGLSTLEAGVSMREDLLAYQRDFYKESIKMSKKDANKGIVFGNQNDRSRTEAFVEIMSRHGIDVHPLAQDMTVNGKNYKKEYSFGVSLDQAQYRLIKIMFEQPVSFQDSLFYDVSAWTLPLAFNLQFDYVDSKLDSKFADGGAFNPLYEPKNDLKISNYGYAFSWGDYFSPFMVNWLQGVGLRAKVATDSFTAEGRLFLPGSIIVPVQQQSKNPREVFELMKYLEKVTEPEIVALTTGATGGINLGSRKISTVTEPRIAMLVEGGVRSYDAGEVWHLLDTRYNIAVSHLPLRNMGRIDLDRYNTLIMVDGSYNSLSKKDVGKLKDWVRKGGKIIAFKRANEWLAKNKIIKVAFDKVEDDTTGREDYEDLSNIRGAQVTGGAIFEADLDISHPLGYGYTERSLPIFVNGTTYMKVPPNPYAYPLKYGDDPLLSGYISEENLQRMKGKAAVLVSRFGSGRVISFGFNPNFRAFWYGTNKLFMNAIFFGDQISSQAALGE